MARQYERIVFLQGEDYNQMVDDLGDNDGTEDMIAYLQQWDSGDSGDIHDEPAAGTEDRVFETDDGYILTVNYRLGYAGLERILDQ